MLTRLASLILILGVVTLAWFAWTRDGARRAVRATAPSPAQPEVLPARPGEDAGGDPHAGVMPGMDAPTPTPADAGIMWDAPASWAVGEPRPMRLASYTTKAAAAREGAPCAVYYFGAGQGGDVDANVQRWVSEFENPGPPERREETIDGMKVHRVAAHGTYRSHGGTTGSDDQGLSDYALLAAIVEGPKGSVFFKLIGPKTDVRAASGEFDAMVRSMKCVN